MPPVLKFLRFSSGQNAEKDLEMIDKASQFAESNEIAIEIIREADEIKTLLSKKSDDNQSIYICFPFEGKIFENLKKKGYRIIGPQCVISCLLLELSVPKQTYPVCNIAMVGVVACCSSMKKEERSSIHELVLVMGGDIATAFTSAVTHLISKEVGSKKYQVAFDRKVPVLLPSWVYSSWEKSKFDHIIASDEKEMKDHYTSIFQGCTICVTGINVTKREDIKMLVKKHGGTYSGELNMKTCTHLLVESPHGQKYTFARQWKLHCVSPLWFYECLKQGRWLDEASYRVEPDSDTTSCNSSFIHKSAIQNTFRESIAPTNNRKVSSKAAELAARSLENSKVVNLAQQDDERTHNLKFKHINSNVIDVKHFKCCESSDFYLDGCKIYLCNVTGDLLDCCRKIINSGGGIRFSAMSETTTHIVIDGQVPSDVKKFLMDHDGPLPNVVSVLWLIDSGKQGEMKIENGNFIISLSVLEKYCY